jgi:hypothetical protein
MKTWKDITYNDFLKIKDVQECEELTNEEKQVELLSIFLDMTEEKINNLTMNEIGIYSRKLNEMLIKLKDEIKDYFKKHKTYKDVILNNQKFEILTDFSNFTYAQFVSFQSYSQQKDNIGMISTIIVPKGKKYGENYDLEEVRKYIGEMPFLDGQALLSFWYRTLVTSTHNSLTSLFQTAKMELKMMKKNKMKKKNLIQRIREWFGTKYLTK